MTLRRLYFFDLQLAQFFDAGTTYFHLARVALFLFPLFSTGSILFHIYLLFYFWIPAQGRNDRRS
ncbi:MAG: hypothetical protein A3H70_01840 [Candidatus Komeilibacteria bacterium RIFCSPLOWO2_02_FULL_48_11]|uniref:Uncharacterized protein n=1 Tax=Candidatus Komeilibacteria bacterium RIFCSPLOWO2_02_FULL_48_11 TaxID=1798553 RepID=A0A1G2BUP0_9BACT|nr:MAG: hypothetical protein A3H70_01840 [Candidatus Komeilibacteria bacterium RIFCSPLOWO2_02_FULL_48_11]